MDQGAGGATEASLTTPQPEVSGGILHAGRGFIGNGGVTLIGAATGGLLTMGVDVLNARFLGASVYGLYALALMLAKSGQLIAVFGMPHSLLHFLPIRLSRADHGAALGAILGSLLAPVAIGLGVTLALWLRGDWVAAHLLGQPAAGPFLAVVGFAIPLMVVIDLLGNVARAFGRALPWVATYNIVPQLCAGALIISLMIWHGPQIGVVYACVLGYAVGAAIALVLAWRLVDHHIGWVRPVLQLRQLYGYGLPVGLNIITTLGIAWTDLFLLGLLTDAKTAGVYRGCMQIVLVFDLGANAFAAALAPVVTVLIAERRHAPLQQVYTSAVRLQTLMALALLSIIMVNAADLLRLLGPDFAVGWLALLLLACGQFAKATLSPATVALIVGGRPKLDAVNVGVAAAANLILNLTLIPFVGLAGAALATATSLVGLAIVRSLQVRRVFGLRTLDFTSFRAMVIMISLALSAWAVSVLLGIGPGSGFATLFLRLAIMAAAIGGSLWFFCIAAADRRMLLRLVQRRGPAAAAAGSIASNAEVDRPLEAPPPGCSAK